VCRRNDGVAFACQMCRSQGRRAKHSTGECEPEDAASGASGRRDGLLISATHHW
jgi:hypothetical protein